MKDNGLVDEKVVESLKGKQMKRMPSSTIPMYEFKMIDNKTVKQEVHHTKHPEYVQVVHNGRSVYLRKTTAVWLFQEYV